MDKWDITADNINEALECLPKAKSYTVTDIFKAYNTWYGSGLKNHIYKAYKNEDCCKVEISDTASKPYEDLNEMIGLTEAKSVIDSIVSTGKVKCMCERMGLKVESISLNMMFAGYPDKMKFFLEQNKGLCSRISFHLNFPDYTPDELVDILNLYARKQEYEIPEKTLAICRDIFYKAVEQQDFGNGRYIRNLIEQAVIRQSDRLVKSGSEITADDMQLLAPEDFKPVTLGVKNLDEIRIGFSV